MNGPGATRSRTTPFSASFSATNFRMANREHTRKEAEPRLRRDHSPDGYILTANHVVDGADEIKVAIGDDKKEYTGQNHRHRSQ